MANVKELNITIDIVSPDNDGDMYEAKCDALDSAMGFSGTRTYGKTANEAIANMLNALATAYKMKKG